MSTGQQRYSLQEPSSDSPANDNPFELSPQPDRREMEVEYKNAPEDIRYMVRVLPWSTIAELLITAPGFVLGATAPAILIFLASEHYILGLGLLLAAVLFAARLLWQTLQFFRKIPVKPGRIRLRITPEFIETEHPEYRSRQAWTYLKSVQRVSGAIILIRPLNRAYIVPDRDFDSPHTAELFYQTALAYHAAAVNQPDGDLAHDVEAFLPDWSHRARRTTSYQNTIGEWAHAMNPGATSLRSSWLGHFTTMLVAVLMNLILAVIAYGTHWQAGAPLEFSPWLGFFALAMATVSAVILTFRAVLKLREFTNRWRVPKTLLEPRSIGISPPGMVVRNRLMVLAIRWPALAQITHNADAIYVSDVLPSIAFIIPKAAFADPTAAESFAEEMLTWYTSAIETSNLGIDAELIEAEVVDGDNPYRSPQS
ncbi:YcxB family protein [Blastopirellula sp. J2-11]|uniref:YcxB family protein n=1 Tax=Blastopirellula sp. J2-11 TaxID=2943192 RepID=UPI0021C8298E|nr:YcxB family protein [Blastopirellula sp. J2-11]UUO06242.1 YcxB family protein [Blastopirellula sp. J2-11]